MDLYLGIDGGGTKTTARLVDARGKRVGEAESGPSNPLKVGLRRAQIEISRAFHLCRSDASVNWPKTQLHSPGLQAVCAGIAGSDRESVRRPLLAWLRKHIPARQYVVTNDAEIALCAAVRDSPGIIVIAGTGSIAYARDAAGKVLRAGGWGIPYDDRGSGYDIARKAVAAALQSSDGRGPQTKLTKLVCGQLSLNNISAIVGLQLSQEQIASLFPLVIKAADSGDRVARRLCAGAASDLAALAEALLRKAGRIQGSIRVVTAGGVFKSSALIRRSFARHLAQLGPRTQVEMLNTSPVEGAVWLARNLAQENS